MIRNPAPSRSQIIDYDQIELWAPWIGDIVAMIADPGLTARVSEARPRYVEDARDAVAHEIGRERLFAHLETQLAPHSVRVFHGTRVTVEEALRIQADGLKPLNLAGRRDALRAIFCQHPDWADKEALLDQEIDRLGARWAAAGVGRREDGSVYFCVSRAGLLHGCNHYLKYGAEVDQHIADALYPDGSGLELLARNRSAKVVSAGVPFAEASRAANPHGVRQGELPDLSNMLLSAWAYRLTRPGYSVARERDAAALQFRAPIGADRLEQIVGLKDDELIDPTRELAPQTVAISSGGESDLNSLSDEQLQALIRSAEE